MTAKTMVLAADVGGTNTKIALAQCHEPGHTIVKRSVYASGGYAAFEGAVEVFLNEPEVKPFSDALCGACFAVAGPVEDGCARLTNLSWRIDERALARHFSIPRVKVINDFAAAAHGIDELAPQELLTLQEGVPVPQADRVIIGAGTGLGVAWLSWNRDHYDVHPSEGGHADFAPADALQDELVGHLRRGFGHVSSERILSGAGLPRILEFLQASQGRTAGQALHDAMGKEDPAAAITEFAVARRDELAVRALDLFVSAYGAFAGNMALIALAHGGVYVAGGIAPKIAAKLPDGTFMRAFTAKGRFVELLQSIPVKVVLNEQVGLLGAIAEAARAARR